MEIIDGFHIEDGVLVEYKGKATKVVVPSGVTEIGDGVFCEFEKITSVTLPSSVTSIGANAFDACHALTEINLPEGLTYIGDEAFEFCYSLKRIHIPSTVTNIGEDVFWCCDGLEEIAVDEKNEVYHSSGNCLIETATKTLLAVRNNSVIPTDGSVTKIGKTAFGSIDGLKSFKIPSVITEIGETAFGYCYELKSVTIPPSVVKIGESAFEECDELSHIYYEGTYEQWLNIDVHDEWLYNTFNVTVHCLDKDVKYNG